MIKADTHIHTKFSADSDTAVESYIEKAMQLNYQAICITDHYDINYTFRSIKGVQFLFNTSNYLKTMNYLKHKYKNKIEVLTGVEMGLLSAFKKQIKDHIDNYEFDFIIGSSHFVGKKEPHLPSFWINRSKKEAILSYFESILENVKKIKCYDIYGHLDYVFRYVPEQLFDFRDYQEVVSAILEIIVKDGKGIEINTGNLRYGLKFSRACEQILKIYKSLNGKIITFGSDAHIVEHLGYRFDSIVGLVKEIGFTYYAVYKHRTPIFYNL